MSYGYNRAEFKSIRGAGVLATVYCKFVTLELALKEALGGLSSSLNGGHDVPFLLHKLSQTSLNPKVVAGRGTLNSLIGELGTNMGLIHCQDRHGKCKALPKGSYPYIRYVRHSSGSWVGVTSTSAQLEALSATVSKIIITLEGLGVTV